MVGTSLHLQVIKFYGLQCLFEVDLCMYDAHHISNDRQVPRISVDALPLVRPKTLMKVFWVDLGCLIGFREHTLLRISSAINSVMQGGSYYLYHLGNRPSVSRTAAPIQTLIDRRCNCLFVH